jgi:hypothetical protein
MFSRTLLSSNRTTPPNHPETFRELFDGSNPQSARKVGL